MIVEDPGGTEDEVRPVLLGGCDVGVEICEELTMRVIAERDAEFLAENVCVHETGQRVVLRIHPGSKQR